MMIVAMVAGALIGLVGWGGGYVFGWNAGTKDTERRWHDAVSRKADAAAEAPAP